MSAQEATEYLTVRPLSAGDAAEVSALLRAQPPDYARFFYALGPGEEEIARALAGRSRDYYAGMFWRGELVAFFMLRGWDAGFEVPSFGVVVDERQKGRGFMRLALDMGKLVAKLSGAPRLMAKIHPDNVSPRGARRLGLVQTGVEEETGNVVYHIEL
ncbi:MAG TPA: GNAT family N-acetyltransferase [Pyrinomonadaceae bacterium]|nr:GNAT family N-acetyltransferase [Pyrinomonadaceae bacterium]